MFAVLALALAAPPAHVVVHHEPGRFAGWPANGGLWAWGDDILVGFITGGFEEKPGHNIAKPYTNRLARSTDGGRTWAVVDAKGYPATTTDHKPLDKPIDLFAADTVLRPVGTGYHAADDGRGGLLVSPDRGRTWAGPLPLAGLTDAPQLKGIEITARADALRAGGELVLMASARTIGTSGTDRVFVAKSKDAGKTFAFAGWVVGPDDPHRAVMPSTVVASDREWVTAIRRRKIAVEDSWIDVYATTDAGATWAHRGRVASTGVGNGNPPALVRLADGRFACFYGDRDTKRMLAKLSGDGGRTWGGEHVLRDGYKADRFGDRDLGYPRAAVRADGAVVVVYYWAAADRPEPHIAATIWTPPR